MRNGADISRRAGIVGSAHGAKAVWDEKGKPLRIAGSIQDITEQRDMEGALRRAEEMLKTQALVLDSMAESVQMASGGGIIFPSNPAWDSIFGYTRGELLGQHVSVLNDPPEEAASAQFLPLVPSRQSGYWGGYSDRLAASAHDTFDSLYSALPALRLQETKGKRLSVEAPENVCFLREGQGWSVCRGEERSLLTENINSVADQWIAFLRNNPTQTGCFSVRDCREQDTESGALLE